MNTGEGVSDYTIVMGARGGITMIASSDWPLDSLLREHGEGMAYRVTPGTNRVSVDGVDGNSSCHFEAVAPKQAALFMLNAMPISYNLALPALAA